MLLKKLLLFLLLSGGLVTINGQDMKPLQVIPPTPEAAAIAKYTDIPVGHATGAAMISVPFYSISAGSLSVPVSLSYNASGIRVEEAATWVGLGWNLNTGGSLTRVVRGIPDDGSNGYMYTPYKAKIMDTMDINSQIMWDIRYGQLDPTYNMDLEPDIFSFSVLGVSGKFYFNQDSGKFILSPYQHIKISYTQNGDNTINSFTLTLANGVKCYFGRSQDQVRSSYERLQAQYTTVVRNFVSSTGQINLPSYITSWSLMDIAEPAGNKLQYYYTEDNVNEFGRGGEYLTYEGDLNSGVPIKNSTYFKHYYAKPVLQKITGDLADIYFVRSSQPRLDVSGNSYALDSVLIKDKTGKRIKRFFLDYGYFTSPDSTELWTLVEFAGIARRRLYLKSVTEVGANATLPPYRFSYNDTELPNRLSAAQDYWGYYNGKNNDPFLTPRLYTEVSGLPEGFTNGADRRVDTNYTQARMLVRVQYPTGGSTAYTYEANQSNILYLNAMSGIERSDLRPRNVHFPRFLFANAPDTLYYTDTFSVADVATKVKVNSILGNCPAGQQTGNCRFHIIIKGVTNPAFEHHITMTDAYYTTIPQGAYTITAIISPTPAGPVPPFGIDLAWSERTDPNNWIVGGLRVKKIVSTDSADNTVSKSLGYHFPGNPSISSGILAGIPTFSYVPVDINGNTLQKAVLSSSVIPLTNNGSIVRYQYVTEYQDSAWTSLKTEYSFSNDWRDPIRLQGNKIIVPATQRDWQNGVLLSKKIYEKTATGFRILLEELHEYKEVQEAEYVNGIRYWLTPAGAKMLTSYKGSSQWYVPDNSKIVSYSYAGNQVSAQEQITRNTYNDHVDVSCVTSENSRGQKIESKTWYPYDYDDVGDFYNSNLLQQYMLNLPVKQETVVNGKVYSGIITQYNSAGRPENIYEYENPVLSDTVIHSRTALPAGNYTLRRTIVYDGSKPIRVLEPGGQMISYIWDYDQRAYPVAEIRNAGDGRVAYTSFETSGISTGNWSLGSANRNTQYAFTGKSCYDVSGGNITGYTLTSGTYVVSYWTRNGGTFNISGTQGTPIQGRTINGWTHFKHVVTGVQYVVISGNGYIDELKLYPYDAVMTTHTYEPGIGVTSTGDVRDEILHYEYDGFNRLLRIRDTEKKILKQYDYQYQAPTRYYNTAQSVARPRGNCDAGATPSTVTYTIAAGTYVSALSQADADQQALNAANAGAQAYANANGTCTWYNIAKSGTYTRNNCGSGYTGGSYTYTVAAGTYSSTVDQPTANALAQTDVDNNGQNAANIYGTCTSLCSPACSVPQQKCINGTCRRGLKIYVSTEYNSLEGIYYCTFYYSYPDGTTSGNYIENSSTPCIIPI